MLGKAAVAPDSASKSASDDQQHGDRDSAGVDVMDPLAGLAESERLALAIRFGRIRMCAALTHGHSFASSIFRLPAKCLGCNELVWGPFTRGCVCLVCKVTAHRSCTGMAGMPPCPTKNIFADFCRSELGLPPLTISSAEPVSTAKVPTESGGGGGGSDASARVQQERAGAGDLDEWATVEGAVAEDAGAVVEKQETTTTKAIVNTPTHFSWSPFATAASKQTVAEASSDKRHHDENHDSPHDQNHEALPIAAVLSPAGMEPACVPSDSSAGVLEEHAAADPAAAAGATMRIRDVGRMSVAGGVVGAVIGGPVGAVFGLKLGAFIGAGRWSVQGLWQRIEKDRREAGAAAVVVAEEEEAVALAPKCRDIWERIAESIEGEEQPVIWCVRRFVIGMGVGYWRGATGDLMRPMLCNWYRRWVLLPQPRVQEPRVCTCFVLMSSRLASLSCERNKQSHTNAIYREVLSGGKHTRPRINSKLFGKKPVVATTFVFLHHDRRKNV